MPVSMKLVLGVNFKKMRLRTLELTENEGKLNLGVVNIGS
jgi:hypothetical protein